MLNPYTQVDHLLWGTEWINNLPQPEAICGPVVGEELCLRISWGSWFQKFGVGPRNLHFQVLVCFWALTLQLEGCMC